MGIIFGIRNPVGMTATQGEVLYLAAATQQFAPDGTFTRAEGRVAMGFQPYYTHERSTLDNQPRLDQHGNLLAFDGRLDNHED